MAGQGEIKLGDRVKDTVSGLEGIATARTTWLNGCDRIIIQPPIDKDGKHQEALSFDEPQVETLELKVVKESSKNTGGPEDVTPTQKATPTQ